MPLRALMPASVMKLIMVATESGCPAIHKATFQVDVDLRGMDTLSVLVELRSSGSATDCPYLGDLQYEVFGDETHAVGFGERDAGPQKDGDGERPLVEGGQERTREQRRAPASQ